MTRADAKKILEAHISPYDKCAADAEANEAIKMAIEALSQEPTEDCIDRNLIGEMVDSNGNVHYEDIKKLPSVQPITTSEDCISRRAALRINELHHGSMPNEVNHEIWEQLKDLPSVQPKHGEWMYMPGMNEQCSECGEYFPVHELTANRPFTINYCPNCGSRMDKQI